MLWNSVKHLPWILWPHLVPHGSHIWCHFSHQLSSNFTIPHILLSFLGILLKGSSWCAFCYMLINAIIIIPAPITFLGARAIFYTLSSQSLKWACSKLATPSLTMQNLHLPAAPTGWIVLLFTSLSKWEVTPPLKHFNVFYWSFSISLVSPWSVQGPEFPWTFIFA